METASGIFSYDLESWISRAVAERLTVSISIEANIVQM